MGTSTCPICGYVFAPFETSCPRCASATAHPAAGPTTPSTDTPEETRPDITPVRPMSKGLYLWSVVAAYVIATPLVWRAWRGLAATPSNADDAERLLIPILPLVAYLAAIALSMYWRMWAAIQDGQTAISPGRAVGLLLVPVFNVYWLFRAVGGWPAEYNDFVRRHNLPVQFLDQTPFAAYCWVPIAGMVVNQFHVPLLSYAVSLPSTALSVLIICRVLGAVNALAGVPKATSAWSGRPATSGARPTGFPQPALRPLRNDGRGAQPVQQSEGQGAGRFPADFPPLRAAIWLRFGVVALTLLAILKLWEAGTREGEWGTVAILVLPILSGILLISFGLPSYFIAVGLLRGSRSVIGFALIHDLLILIISVLPSAILLTGLWYPGMGSAWEPLGVIMLCAPSLGLGLAFAAEGAYLLSRAWKWRPAWRVFGLLAVGMASTVTIVPQLLWAQQARDVRPLLTYVNAHWVKIPSGARLALGQSTANSGSHTDHVFIRVRDLTWRLSAEHGPDGRWTFPETRYPDPTFSASHSHFPAGPDVFFPCQGRMYAPRTGVRVAHSVDEAKLLLLQGGVVDTDLRLEQAVTKQRRFYPFYPPAYAFWFWSPVGQGYYCVDSEADIGFYLEQPQEVP